MHRLSRLVLSLALSLALAALPAAAHAVAVTSVATPVSGTTWKIASTLDTSGAGVTAFAFGAHRIAARRLA